jgi:hypothetical protein
MGRFIISEEEKKHIMGLYEQPTDKVPAITSIEVETPTAIDGTNISFVGVLGVINCDGNPNTKNTFTSTDNKKLDTDLIGQAIGDDTKIVVYYYDTESEKFVRVYEEPQRKDSTVFTFEFEKNKIPNLSDDTQLAVGVYKGDKPYKYNGKNVYTLTKGFML